MVEKNTVLRLNLNGKIVKAKGLQNNTTWNGKEGTITNWTGTDPSNLRYGVRMEFKLKAEKLKPVDENNRDVLAKDTLVKIKNVQSNPGLNGETAIITQVENDKYVVAITKY